MTNTSWHADASTLDYRRACAQALTDRVNRWPSHEYPVSGDMLALMDRDRADKWQRPAAAEADWQYGRL